MIQVKVRYFNILAAYAGTSKQMVEMTEGATILDLLLYIAQNNPASFREIMLQDGKPSPHLRVFRNNQLMDPDSFSTILLKGDEILLFPAVAGGTNLFLPFIKPTGEDR